mmetsp:Transcript_6393/g.12981  ORF Transcript_6393/g.12981 Transcript_6393/m.12981 type:complete len:415 (-) Transcript_6393:26-1270(-)|eukprot:CAMPEP_0118938602 /NCGR_PEP_ID=MMETSP1169-20130426/26479_1 /TAXON_ID=36882 /ORGANISM="Pyramimonas obovata, Strain CCMP722" /LENGTH=414 /DNA_ID=CAMNT_0006882581 /DNA_START=238 /DNA_END=1482 /DNA_ORIENTATION=-
MAYPATPFSSLRAFSVCPALSTESSSQYVGPRLAPKRRLAAKGNIPLKLPLQPRLLAWPSRVRAQRHKGVGSHLAASADTQAPEATPTRRPRVVDLMKLFEWEIPPKYAAMEAKGVASELLLVGTDGEEKLQEVPVAAAGPGGGPRMVLLDGANLAWGYGQAVASRFKCGQRPLSRGVLMALHHQPWLDQGFQVRAVMPFSYVQGEISGLADGGSVHRRLKDKVVQLKPGKNLWRNLPLWEEYEAGRLILVKRQPTEEGRKLDDLTIIKTAHETGSYVCSNDMYRDHRRCRTLGFRNFKRLKAWAAERKFGFTFHVATGLSDQLLSAMWQAKGWVSDHETDERTKGEAVEPSNDLKTGGSEEGTEDDDALQPCLPAIPNYHAMPADVLPVVFEPVPNSAMLSMLLSASGAGQKE